MTNERFYTIIEAGQLLGVTRQTIHAWINEQKLAFVQVADRRFISQAEINRIKALRPEHPVLR